MRKFASVVATIAFIVAAIAIGPAASRIGAADHLDGARVATDGRVDINDVYVFHPGMPGKQNLDRTVFVMTVNPAAGVLSGADFRVDALYDFLIDTNGDAKEDITISTHFSPVQANGSQRVIVRWLQGQPRIIAQGQTETTIKGANGVKAFAGLRDDPFFFDLDNFNNGATFCGAGLPVSNFFFGLNTSALVIEVPTAMIGYTSVGVWGRTLTPEIGQFDRMAIPAINTVFIPNNPFEPAGTEPSQKDAFNSGKPRNDQRDFRSEIVDTLLLLGNDQTRTNALADVLLPDILPVDLSLETRFLNGRNLADDVIDAELALITNGAITTDCVDNDSVFLDKFPYLGLPN